MAEAQRLPPLNRRPILRQLLRFIDPRFDDPRRSQCDLDTPAWCATSMGSAIILWLEEGMDPNKFKWEFMTPNTYISGGGGAAPSTTVEHDPSDNYIPSVGGSSDQ
jgi:hypothetical protein